jgi:hypothetical protein
MKSVQELSDRLEIQDQVTAYSYAVDFHQWDDLDAIFTPDATLDFTATGGEKGNLESTKVFFERALNLFERHQHLMGNTAVELDGDTATSKTLCHNPMITNGADGQQQTLFVGLWYHDTWLRTTDGWRISSRRQEKGYMTSWT